MYTLDTNVLIYHLHDEQSARAFIDESMRNFFPLYISTITVTELLKWPGLPSSEELAIEELLTALSVLPLDVQIARIAGQLGRNYNLKLADSIIAATALFTGSTLVTRNVRDFRRVPSLTLQNI